MGLFGFGKKEKDKMKDGLEKTRTGFWGSIMNTLTGSKIDDDLYDELEEQLILADVGGDVAIKLVDALRDRLQEKGLKAGNLVKEISAIAGGKGGGKPDFAMAGLKEETKIDEALAAVKGIVEKQLG